MHTAAEFQPYIEYLAEFSNRRRANAYFANPQSIFNGVQVNFVNVGKGNATFTRRDLVVPGRMPIVFARVFDSSGNGSIDFGPGWNLSIAERVEVSEQGAVLYSESGDRVEFIPHGQSYVLSKDRPSDYRILERAGDGALTARLATGIVKRFTLIAGAYRLTTVDDRFGNALTINYVGALISAVQNGNHTIAIQRDRAGRIITVIDDSNRVATFAYDPQGRLVASIDLAGNRWPYSYRGNLLQSAQDPEGRLNFKLWYENDGRVAAVELPGGKITYQYDDANRITTVIDRKSLANRYHQNIEGITTEIENALGETSIITLDGARNVAELTYNGLGIGRFTYSSDHHLLHRDGGYDGEDESADYTYQSGVLTKINYSDGTKQDFSYSGGDLASTTARDGSVTNYRYDASGNLLEVSAPGRHILLTYNTDGMIASVKSDAGGSELLYGEAGRLKGVRAATPKAIPNGRSLQSENAVTMDYNALGLRKDVSFNDGRQISYTFDAGANLRAANVKMASGETDGERLVLDPSYAVTQQIFADGSTANFKYDKNGNLVEASADWGTTHYEYDKLDRLTAVVKTDGTRLQYAYAPGEPSLVVRAHSEYAGKWGSAIDAGASFKSALATYGTRTSPVPFGVVGVGSGAFIFVPGEYDEFLSPSTRIELPLHNLRLEHLLNHEEKEFYAPSNSLFLPAEFSTLNCCICPGAEGPAMTDQPCMRCYPDPPDPPVVTFPSFTAIPLNTSLLFTVTVNPTPSPRPLTLNLRTLSGTGSAKFVNGTTSKTIYGTIDVQIDGLATSSALNNIRFEVKDGINLVTYKDFTVIWVTVGFRNSGTVSADNSASGQYLTTSGTSSLGNFHGAYWQSGVELTGTVQPSAFSEQISFVRTADVRGYSGSTLITSKAVDDTSNPSFRDDFPHSGGSLGVIYDVDSPGIDTRSRPEPDGTVFHERVNFASWAIYDGIATSGALNWYARVSVTKQGGGQTDTLSNSIAGDNQTGLGSTQLTWNLQ